MANCKSDPFGPFLVWFRQCSAARMWAKVKVSSVRGITSEIALPFSIKVRDEDWTEPRCKSGRTIRYEPTWVLVESESKVQVRKLTIVLWWDGHVNIYTCQKPTFNP